MAEFQNNEEPQELQGMERFDTALPEQAIDRATTMPIESMGNKEHEIAPIQRSHSIFAQTTSGGDDVAPIFPEESHVKDTTVEQEVLPAITHETISSTEHDIEQKVVQKEVDEEIYHTTVQDVVDNKSMPERHIYTRAPIEEKHLDERNDAELKQQLADEAAQFKDVHIVKDTEVKHDINPVITDERVHYHVHEKIQPVIQREVVQPTVVHTTIPVHEIHHKQARFTPATHLPPVSLEDFKRHGGTLGGREAYHDEYLGEPRSDSGEKPDNAAERLYDHY